jgi:hypothetical protein
MGRRYQTKGCAALELSQISDRRDGNIAEVFPERVEPTDTRVKTTIARALAAA